MALEQDIAALVAASDNLTQAVEGKIVEIDSKVHQAENKFDTWMANFSETINGIEVYKQGQIRRFFFGQSLSTGGYTASGGPDTSFPTCNNPQPPYYVNLLEFIANSGFGVSGDIFRIEFIMTHRGMYSSDGYTDHFIFTGTTWNDCVAGELEVKKVARDGAISVFTSEPNTVEKELALTNAMEGTRIPVTFRHIGQGYDTGTARITLKIDTRYHCGSTRAFGADVTYISSRGRPAVTRVSQTKPKWDV